jgi:hypothetical protein
VVAEHLADREHAVLEAQVRVQVGQELVEAAAREPAGPVGGVGLEHEPQLRPRARSAPERDGRHRSQLVVGGVDREQLAGRL